MGRFSRNSLHGFGSLTIPRTYFTARRTTTTTTVLYHHLVVGCDGTTAATTKDALRLKIGREDNHLSLIKSDGGRQHLEQQWTYLATPNVGRNTRYNVHYSRVPRPSHCQHWPPSPCMSLISYHPRSLLSTTHCRRSPHASQPPPRYILAFEVGGNN